jgi:uncharacterized protein
MPGAGFYSIHTSKLTFRSDGRWYADDEPVVHERLARLFSRYLRRKPSGGYEIWIDERYHADVEVEDTPYVVTAVDTSTAGEFTVDLNDGTTELLDPNSLQVGADDVLYCRVKNGAERARFLRPAYYQLANFIEEVGAGRFQLRCGGVTHPIVQL